MSIVTSAACFFSHSSVQAEKAERVAAAVAANPDCRKDAEISESWHPMLVLCIKVCIIYRGVHFMSKEQRERFFVIIQMETEANRSCFGASSVLLFVHYAALL